MALLSDALSTVASLKRHMQTRHTEVDFLRLFRDSSGGATSATVAVTSTTVELVTNLGTDSLTFAANATLTAMVAAINALSGWTAVAEGDGTLTSSDLRIIPAVNCYLVANERYLRGLDNLLLEDGINQATEIIKDETDRNFLEATYRHAFHGSDRDTLIVREYPITDLLFIAVGRLQAATVEYSGSSALYATAEVTSTALVLRSNVSGTENSDTITLATETLSSLKTAVDAVSNWTMSNLPSNGDTWDATQLLMTNGRINALQQAARIELPNILEADYFADLSTGIIHRGRQFVPGGVDSSMRVAKGSPSHAYQWLGQPSIPPYFPRGQFNVIVSYKAGYATIPDGLVRLCNELAANLIRAGRWDGALVSESMTGHAWVASLEGPLTEQLRQRLMKWENPTAPEFLEV